MRLFLDEIYTMVDRQWSDSDPVTFKGYFVVEGDEIPAAMMTFRG